MSAPARLRIYVDGASRGNPGPASYGVCILDEGEKVLAEFCDVIGIATNSIAEYRALLRGLAEARKMGARELLIFTDSQLVARQYDGTYRVKDENLKELMRQVRELSAGFDSVTVTHIPRSSHAGNKRADRLANIALNRADSSSRNAL